MLERLVILLNDMILKGLNRLQTIRQIAEKHALSPNSTIKMLIHVKHM